MKAYTDSEQSKKLAEMLPLESADMFYWCGEDVRLGNYKAMDLDFDIPCWSLAALLDILPSVKALVHVKGIGFGYQCICKDIDTGFYNNSVDACVEMIMRLHELKIL